MTVENMEGVSILVEKSRGGDRDAFARLVEKYQGMVSAVTLNIVGDYAQSEDLAQETFLTAWNKLSELREPEKSASWFYGIAKRVALRWRERQQKNPLQGAAELDAETMTDRRNDSEDRRHREQSLQLVWSTVKELPETLREPLLLYYRYSKSVADIAESMQLTEEAVRQRLSRGRKMLKAEVEKQVENVLESTRPDTAFTVAVLASLPLAATASGCTATGMGAAAGAQSGWSFFWTVGLCLFAPVIFVTGGFMGLWTALKHSPTVRTRRFMCRAALQWYLLIWAYMLVKLKIDHGYGGWDTHGGAFFFGYFAILLVYCGRLVYRWRMLLEEDAGLRPGPTKPLEKTSLSRFRLRCWYWATLLPVGIFSALMVCDLFGDYLRNPHFEEEFGIWAAPFLVALGMLWMSIPFGFFFVIGYGLRTAKDETSLLRWYPRDGKVFLPKPEEATRLGAFWFDVGVLFLSTVLPMIFLVRGGMMMDGLAAWVLLSTMMMTVATLIASHSAGLPGKRLRGYAKLWLFAGLCYVLLVGRCDDFTTTIPPLPGTFYISPKIILGVAYFGAALAAYLIARRRKRRAAP